MTMSPAPHPRIQLQAGRQRRVAHGYPWVYSNEIVMDAAAKALPAGSVTSLVGAGGDRLGTGLFNPHSLIAWRLLDAADDAAIDRAWLASRLRAALALRQSLYDRPHYRLVHGEADGLPGLVIDRYGDRLVVQANSAGFDRLGDELLAALDQVLAPQAVLLRNDSPVRQLEGLAEESRWTRGEAGGPVEIEENGLTFFADLAGGQKTGWFFDQRDNRAFVAHLARGRTMLDVYCYAGGFGVTAAAAGAGAVTLVDRSEAALDLARLAADRNDVAERCRLDKAEAFADLARRGAAKEQFGVVACDPPAFVKSRKDFAQGAKGYRKLARLAAALVEPGGFLFLASCSHNMEAERFRDEVVRGCLQAGRTGRLLRQAGAAPDHPVHPLLPESAYLKALVLQLD